LESDLAVFAGKAAGGVGDGPRLSSTEIRKVSSVH
jgi:hypothetical protein